ncbi:multidrug transporter [Calditrichota bacterium]
MNEPKPDNEKSYMIVGGTTMVGIGVGFFFLQTSPLYFVACILIGIGVGLALETLTSK